MNKLVIEKGVVFGCDENIKKVVLPQNTTTINESAFYESDLEEIVLNDGLRLIETFAFLGTNIKSLHIPASVEHIGAGFVSGCRELKSITVDENNENFYMSNNCLIEPKTKRVIVVVGDAVIPEGTSEIAALAFYGRDENTAVEIPESVEIIRKVKLNMPTFLEFPIIIKAKKDSFAISFAKQNGIEFQEI